VESLAIDQLRFTVRDGSELVLSPTVRPESPAGPLTSPEAIVIVLPDGKAGRDLTVLVDGLRSPGATLMATGSEKATPNLGAPLDVQVELAVPPAPPTSIEVKPSQIKLSENSSTKLVVTAQLADGKSRDVTDEVDWQSSDPTVAIVEAGAIATTKQKAGTATLTASLDQLTSSTMITVTEAKLTSLEMVAGTTTLHLGQSVQYKVVGHFDDGSQQDYTELSMWTSMKPAVATVSDQAGSKGKVTGLLVGSTPITAKFGDKTASVSVDVTL
jgi:hypothetical protein